MADSYSTRNISSHLLEEILQSVKSVRGWGSVEIFIQNYVVTQITEKNIKKPNSVVKNKIDILTGKNK